MITPSEESIDNVRIVTNDYDAENARFAGAQTMVTSKSGTNQFHGSAFIAIHRPGLNAYNRAVRDATGTTGGCTAARYAAVQPVRRQPGRADYQGRIFAFFAYEASPNSSTATEQRLV